MRSCRYLANRQAKCFWFIFYYKLKKKVQEKTVVVFDIPYFLSGKKYNDKLLHSWLYRFFLFSRLTNMLKYLTHKLRTQSINEDNVHEKVCMVFLLYFFYGERKVKFPPYWFFFRKLLRAQKADMKLT